MPWYIPGSEYIKKRACRYLLQHYVGQLLQEKLSLDQLSVDLYNGTGKITDLSLDVNYLNETLESTNAPLEIVDGFIGSITVSIPWSSLVKDSTSLVVQGLELTLHPKERNETGDATGAMWASTMSMTSSLQLAEECLRSEKPEAEQDEVSAEPYEGVQKFAETIDSVLSRVKITFLDTLIKLEHLPKESEKGVVLELRVQRMEYFDDIVADTGSSVDDENFGSSWGTTAVAHKNLHIMGVALYLDEFLRSSRSFSQTVPPESPPQVYQSAFSSVYQSSLDQTSPESPKVSQPKCPSAFTFNEPKPIQIGVMSGRQEFKVKIKQMESVPGPQLEISFQLGALHLLLTPKQFHYVLELAKGITAPDTSDKMYSDKKSNKYRPMNPSDFQFVEYQLQQEIQQKHTKGDNSLTQPDIMMQSVYCQGGPGDDMFHSMLPGKKDSTVMDSSLNSDLSSCSITSASTATGYSTDTKGTRSKKSKGITLSGVDCTLHPHDKSLLSTVKQDKLLLGSDEQVLTVSGNGSPVGGCSVGSIDATRQPIINSANVWVIDTRPKSSDDASSDVTRFLFKLSFISICLLHENPCTTPGDQLSPEIPASEKMRKLSETFFKKVTGIATSGLSVDLSEIRTKMSEILPHSHLGLLFKTVSFDCSQKLALTGRQSMDMNLCVGYFELVECLFDRGNNTHSTLGFSLPIENKLPQYTEIIVFKQEEKDVSGADMYSSIQAKNPCIRCHVTNESASRSGVSRMNVSIDLASVMGEVDITIADRINSLLNPECLQASNHNYYTQNPYDPYTSQLGTHYFNQAIEEAQSSKSSTTRISISSPSITFFVRFPIPDLRPPSQVDRFPWWKRMLHKEILIIEMSHMLMSTTISSDNTSEMKFEIMCQEAQGYFKEDSEQPPVHFVHITSGEEFSSKDEQAFDRARIVISVYNKVTSVLEDDNTDSDNSPPIDSLNGACQFVKSQPSPFSSKKSLYEKEEISDKSEVKHISEEMVIPGDKEEMKQFQDKSMANTKLSVEIYLPVVNACLESKQFFEILYNRVNNDLLMWEPTAPTPVTVQESIYPYGPSINLDIGINAYQPGGDQFEMARSGLQYESDSGSDDSFHPYYSIHESRYRQSKKKDKLQKSQLCVSLNIGSGNLSAFLPLKAENDGGVHVQEYGKFIVELNDATLFSVVSYNGDPELRYVCFQANQAQLRSRDSLCTAVRDLSSLHREKPDYIISKSGSGTLGPLSGDIGCGPESSDMVTVAVKIKLDSLTNVKEFVVSVGARGGTLRHKVAPSGHSWISQVLDFLDVKDYPILGYQEPKVITEFHLHLWNCSVDYRPLYLPYKAVISAESFCVSSNIVTDAPTSLLRFVLDDSALFLSNKNVDSVDLKSDYVCLADMERFELSLRTSDHKDQRSPKIGLRLSNNRMNIRTCSDSGKALMELIQYFASDGDLKECTSPSSSVQSSFVRDDRSSEADKTTDDEESLSGSKMEQVHDLMEDAMRESVHVSNLAENTKENEKKQTKLYFMAENAGSETVVAGTDVRQIVISDSSESVTSSMMSEPTENVSDEEFCVIDDPGLGITPGSYRIGDRFKCGGSQRTAENHQAATSPCQLSNVIPHAQSRDGAPVVRFFTDNPINIIDNHFAKPLGKIDQLKAPEHFPSPEYQYTLKELTIHWFMYGGQDFGRSLITSSPSRMVKSPRRSPGSGSLSGRISKDDTLGQTKLTWQVKGGPGRNHEMLMELQLSKVRMQYEIYPITTQQASRQVILIQDLEIKDHLHSSKMNKFLYHYTSENMPRQTHANMVRVVAVHNRPDPDHSAQECSLKVSLLPLRLNIDQDSLFFLRKLFIELSGDSVQNTKSNTSSPKPIRKKRSSSSTPAASPPAPVMAVAHMPSPDSDVEEPQESLIMFDEIAQDQNSSAETEEDDSRSSSEPVFFKSYVFSPDVPIRLDYQGKNFDRDQGPLIGLLVGLAQLNCSELTLKRLDYKNGLLGVNKLINYTVNEWLEDMKKNQLRSILGGVGPMHSLVQLVQGIRDLFWLPVEQYKKDGRVFRGIQRGTSSFTTCTAMACLELTNRLVQTVQYMAEFTYDMLSPGPSVQQKRKKRKRYVRSGQPADFREGVANAYVVLREGLTDTAQDIVKVATVEHDQKGLTGAVGGVLRQIPPSIVKPLILTTEATSNVLGGMRNQLQPDARKEDEEKWKLNDDINVMQNDFESSL